MPSAVCGYENDLIWYNVIQIVEQLPLLTNEVKQVSFSYALLAASLQILLYVVPNAIVVICTHSTQQPHTVGICANWLPIFPYNFAIGFFNCLRLLLHLLLSHALNFSCASSWYPYIQAFSKGSDKPVIKEQSLLKKNPVSSSMKMTPICRGMFQHRRVPRRPRNVHIWNPLESQYRVFSKKQQLWRSTL